VHERRASQAGRGGALAAREWCEGRSTGQAAVGEGAEGAALSGGLETNLSARPGSGDGLGVALEGDGGKWRDGEVGALRAGLDEGGGEGEDGAHAKRGVEGRWDGDDLGRGADEGLVARLDGEDRAGRGEDLRRGEEGGGTQIAV
jgi:hypothetical protein